MLGNKYGSHFHNFDFIDDLLRSRDECLKRSDFSQVNPMASLRELHIKSLKVRSLAMANFLLDSFPSLEKTSSWTLNMNVEDTKAFRARVKEYRERGVKIEYKEW